MQLLLCHLRWATRWLLIISAIKEINCVLDVETFKSLFCRNQDFGAAAAAAFPGKLRNCKKFSYLLPTSVDRGLSSAARKFNGYESPIVCYDEVMLRCY